LKTPSESKDDWEVDNEFNIEPNNAIEDPKFPELQDMRAAPEISRLITPTGSSKKNNKMGLIVVNTIEMRRKMRIKQK
jgi:hypothetical protein